jgi:hypothetical protein
MLGRDLPTTGYEAPPTYLRRTLLATPHPTYLRRTILIYAACRLATLHPT